MKYSYNGMILPGLPELPEAYQHITIGRNRTESVPIVAPYTHYLYATDRIPVWTQLPGLAVGFNSWGLNCTDGSMNIQWYGYDGSSWVFIKQETMTESDYAQCWPFWANYNLLKSDGNLEVAESEAVPESNPNIIFKATLTTLSETDGDHTRGVYEQRSLPLGDFVKGKPVRAIVDGVVIGEKTSTGDDWWVGNLWLLGGSGTDDGSDYYICFGDGFMETSSFMSRAAGTYEVIVENVVPVTETDHNARIMGWIVGKRLAAQRGRA